MKLITLFASAGLFSASLTQKCYCTAQCGDSILALLTGWMGIAYLDYAALPWLANPAILLAWLLFWRNPHQAIGFSVLSTALAAGFLFVDAIVDNEGGVRNPVTKLEKGYWLWLSSHFTFFLGCSIHLLHLRIFPKPTIVDN